MSLKKLAKRFEKRDEAKTEAEEAKETGEGANFRNHQIEYAT